MSTQKIKLTVSELVIFSMLAAIMFISRFSMQWLPGVHFVGLTMAAATVTYHKKALIPIYVYIMVDGVMSGFAMWWLPYLYIWLPLWCGIILVMKISQKFVLPKKITALAYMLVCGFHGLGFGLLYAPAQCFLFGLPWKAMWAWVFAGLPFDAVHGISNFCMSTLVLPLSALLKKLSKKKC